MILKKRTTKLCGKYKVVECVEKWVYSDKIPRFFYRIDLYHIKNGNERYRLGGNDTEKITEETAKDLIEQLEKGANNLVRQNNIRNGHGKINKKRNGNI